MAFIDFSENAAVLDRPVTPLTKLLAGHPAEFSSLEKRVLELSHQDGLETLLPQPKRSWFGKLLFGPLPPPRTFANERLEALRRLAVETRHHGWRVSSSAIVAAKAAGFSEIQIGRVIDTIGHFAPSIHKAPAQRNPA